jgi:Rap1a immunity proteins
MKKLFTTAAILICTAASPAIADPPANGNDWVADCGSKSDWRRVSCYMYARGLADGLAAWQIISPETAPACIDGKVISQQLVDVGLAYIKAHPATRADYAGMLLSFAFIEAWRCHGDESKAD